MQPSFVEVDGHRIERVWHEPPGARGAPLVFLHEGLGCVSLWRDFPAEVARATGRRALVYSRQGYGKSDPIPLPRPLTYMHDEGRVALPALLAAEGVTEAILIGHSDGASIALIHAGSQPAVAVRGLVLLAPHVFCEEVSVRSIAAADLAFREGDLARRLERHHGPNTTCAFRGWCDAWLDPAFLRWNIEEFLPAITAPLLLIQGAGDEYGTRRQIEAIEAGVRGPVETLILAPCGHSPQRDQPAATLDAITRFVGAMER
jgi:pimeloyl-ACP methyl ester carboxylesterase